MRKPTVTLQERIAVRAYFIWENRFPAVSAMIGNNPERDWLRAEAIELALADKRSVAARKAAETRALRVTTVKGETVFVTTGNTLAEATSRARLDKAVH